MMCIYIYYYVYIYIIIYYYYVYIYYYYVYILLCIYIYYVYINICMYIYIIMSTYSIYICTVTPCRYGETYCSFILGTASQRICFFPTWVSRPQLEIFQYRRICTWEAPGFFNTFNQQRHWWVITIKVNILSYWLSLNNNVIQS